MLPPFARVKIGSKCLRISPRYAEAYTVSCGTDGERFSNLPMYSIAANARDSPLAKITDEPKRGSGSA